MAQDNLHLQDNSAAVGLTKHNLGESEGLGDEVPLGAADGAARVSVTEDLTSSNASVPQADISEALQKSSIAGQAQGPAESSATQPSLGTDLSGGERQRVSASPLKAAEPIAEPQQAERSKDDSSDGPTAVGAGPSRLDADISQLPERLRHIRFSGDHFRHRDRIRAATLYLHSLRTLPQAGKAYDAW